MSSRKRVVVMCNNEESRQDMEGFAGQVAGAISALRNDISSIYYLAYDGRCKLLIIFPGLHCQGNDAAFHAMRLNPADIADEIKVSGDNIDLLLRIAYIEFETTGLEHIPPGALEYDSGRKKFLPPRWQPWKFYH